MTQAMLDGNIFMKTMPRALALVLLLSAASSATAKDVVGIVTSVSGAWYADGVRLTQGHRLAAGAVVKAKEPNVRYARVVVMLLDHTEISHICDRKGLCGEPLVLPEAVNPEERARPGGPRPPGFWERFVDALALGRRRPVRGTLARGGQGFICAVGKLDGGRIELDAALGGGVRQYAQVDIDAADPGTGSAAQQLSERVPIRVGAGGRFVLDTPSLAPGLYTMTFKAPAARGIPPPPLEVSVLAVGPREYARAARELRAAQRLVGRWDEKNERDDFLRAFLRALSADEAH